MNPQILARRICAVVQNGRVPVTTEAQAHDAIEALLISNGLEVRREVRLSQRDRVDLMCEGVAIEVKVATSRSRRSIYQQLQRYAKHDQVEAIVLATGAMWPANLSDIDGTPLFQASLTVGWL